MIEGRRWAGDLLQRVCAAGPDADGAIDYVSAAIDPATAGSLVRATIYTKDGQLQPEMFRHRHAHTPGDHPAVGFPKQA